MTALTIDGSTRQYGIVGDPITQVKTPELMNAFFQQNGINTVCVPLQVAAATFDSSLRGIMALGNVAGLVITVPHKVRACALADTLSAQAQRVGAVNVLRRDAQGAWLGDMFDGAGLVAGLQAEVFTLRGQHVKQLGGSGAAVIFALLAAGVAALTLCDPNGDAAQAQVDRINAHYPNGPARVSTAPADLDGIDLLINCSPVGMQPGEGLPAPFTVFSPALQAVDIIMHPPETPLIARSRQACCRATNGRPMIEGQLAAFLTFFGLNAKESPCRH
ncbi:shikimate dehydrogenase [Candidatus Sodalis endolongispinus]|uniref:Shikimate dehydrogenase n=1 Tax=Candidatus Sodalis endolongispinus TaxID=2812662 RepID=A0ABS5YBK3_9GAMM|nr:shikimate dehydrogenase [Candidatus Sodalis endolongispinus]MBT9432349.1 shikimate dehydrogenase [Candidatus Sodalis endolongispinus]